MKCIQKVFLVFIVITLVLVIIPRNVSIAGRVSDLVGTVTPAGQDVNDYDKLQITIGKVLGFLQVASGLVSIVVIAITGFNFIVSQPKEKEEMKDKMLPIVIGLVLVFSAVSISKFILGAVKMN